MKIKLSQTNFQQGLQVLQRAIPTKPTLPILSSLLLTADNKGLTISTTDLYVGIQTVIECDVIEPGQGAVPGKVLAETVSQLEAGELEITGAGSELVMQSKSGTSRLPLQSAEDFPEFPKVDGADFELPTSVLAEILANVSFAASADITRPVLTGLLWQFSPDGLKVVGTDGFRLSIWETADVTTSETSTLLLPAKALQEVGKIAALHKADQVAFKVASELKQVLCQVGPTTVYVRLLDGEYPPYQKIVPSNFTCQFEFDTAELVAHLKRALIFARDSSNTVQWQILPETCVIKATSATSGTHEGRLPIQNPDQTVGEIAFNARYVLDFLQATSAERCWFGMMESLKPALFKPQQTAQVQYVVMPFRVQG